VVLLEVAEHASRLRKGLYVPSIRRAEPRCTEGGGSARINPGVIAVIDPNYRPAVSLTEKAYASYSAWCTSIGIKPMDFDTYAGVRRTTFVHPSEDKPDNRSPNVRKQGAEYVICH
jgi:hypothetical protein